MTEAVPQMRPLCVIPARGGSKRLPRKNVAPLMGRPMVEYTIEAAKDSGLFEHIYVSTDDEEIADVSSRAGAVTLARPAELAGDMVSATDVCLHVEQTLSAKGQRFDAIVCLQPTSPLRGADDVRGAWTTFVESQAKFLVSVTPIDPHYFHWALSADSGQWRMFFGDKFLVERPLLPPVQRPNGAVKIGSVPELTALRHFFGAPLEVFPMAEESSLHVAEAADLDLAAFWLQRRVQSRQSD